MSNLFRYGGPYEISIDSYGSTLADLPIKFARQFSTFGPGQWLLFLLVDIALWTLIDKFFKITPRGIMKRIPIVGKYV